MIENFIEKIKKKSQNLNGQKMVTIAFLGDSVTQGCFELYKTGEKSIETVFESENSYSSKLKKIFSVLYPKVALNIINAGISGENAVSGNNRVERDVLPYNPDLVVVCFGLNDSCSGIDGITRYTTALDEIFKKLKQKNIDTIFMTPNMMNDIISPHISDEFYIELSKTMMKVQNNNILENYLNAGKQTAKSNEVSICDCHAKWKQLNLNGVNTTSLLSNHLNHPTREMHWLFAYSLAETILF